MTEIVVVGSLNLDTTVQVPRLPSAGETVLGSGHFEDTGGKGANQAVAAARLGRSVRMVGCVGSDDAGSRLLSSLAAQGVDISGVRRAKTSTGVAVITVDDGGENMIVVDPGANAELTPADVADGIGETAAVLCQLEIPLETVAAALEGSEGISILNPAPARPLPESILEHVDVLVPNATELALVAGGSEPESPREAARLAGLIGGPGAIVVTLGAMGAVAVEGPRWVHVPAPKIEAVDPTAAGDAFCGGLADALVAGVDLEEAVGWAVRCGAVAATRWGAQASLPTRRDVEQLEETQ